MKNKKGENMKKEIALRKQFNMAVQLTNLGTFSYKLKCQLDMSGT